MTSSFQNVLLLDSGNIVIENPDPFFDIDLFREYSMITWSDYWRRIICPHLDSIYGAEINKRKRARYDRLPMTYGENGNNFSGVDIDSVAFHDLDGTVSNFSTELGQLLANNFSHGKTLLF